ncbi:MAG: hypothetical protein ACR2MK_10745, partial [Solirubrobacteraceae bacterium]
CALDDVAASAVEAANAGMFVAEAIAAPGYRHRNDHRCGKRPKLSGDAPPSHGCTIARSAIKVK